MGRPEVSLAAHLVSMALACAAATSGCQDARIEQEPRASAAAVSLDPVANALVPADPSPQSAEMPTPPSSAVGGAGNVSPPAGTVPKGPPPPEEPSGAGMFCFPNRNGQIEAEEIPLTVPARARFKIAKGASLNVDVTGRSVPAVGNATTWDYSQSLPGEKEADLWLLPPTGRWFSSNFPDATYLSPLDDEKDFWGVFRSGESGLDLLGYVSLEPKRVHLTYSKPLPAFRYPLAVGNTWEEETALSGLLEGIQIYRLEHHAFKVEEKGIYTAPVGDFRVVRVREKVTEKNALGRTTASRQVVFFVGECLGIVARIISRENEASENFTQGQSVWKAVGPSPGPATPPAEPSSSRNWCFANLDGSIEASEIRFDLGTYARSTLDGAGTDAPVDLTGTVSPSGVRQWDFTAPLNGDHSVDTWLASAEGRWIKSFVPNATYFSLLDEELETYGVFETQSDKLLFLGLTSDEPDKIALKYSKPVALLEFPLAVGKTWSVKTRLTGTYGGTASVADVDYTFTVEDKGDVTIPAGSFKALKIRSDVSFKHVKGQEINRHKVVYFLAECAGVLARVVSRDGEGNGNFTQAKQVWRTAPPPTVPPPLPPEPAKTQDWCRSDENGVLQRAEFPIPIGTTVPYLISGSGVSVDVAGFSDAESGWAWDFTPALTGDARKGELIRSPSGAWWFNSFPDATYWVVMDETGDLYGVFQATDTDLLLRGLVSGAPNTTKLTYNPAVSMIKFPMSEGQTWTASSQVTGTFNGIAACCNESYNFAAGKAGDIQTPLAAFRVLRQKSTLSRTACPFYVCTIETRKISGYVGECAGLVARARSQNNETKDDFTAADEVKRATP